MIQFYKTAFYLAVQEENIEKVKLLLNDDKLDINLLNILNIFLIKFKIISFNQCLQKLQYVITKIGKH